MSKRNELREQILAIDTSYDVDDIEVERFLPPNYYIDRLVDFIDTYTERKELEARISEVDLFGYMPKGVSYPYYAEQRTAELKQLQNKSIDGGK